MNEKLHRALRKHLGDIDKNALNDVPEVQLRGLLVSLENEGGTDMPSLSASERLDEAESPTAEDASLPALSASDRIQETQ